MKRIITLFLLLLALFIPNSVFAEAGGPTSCDEKIFCEKGRWIKKSGCIPSSDFSKQIAACKGNQSCIDNLGTTSTSDLCVCDFQQLSGTCDTQGGVREGADSIKSVFGKVDPPAEIARLGFGEKGISNVLQVIIRLIYIVAAIAFVLLFLWSAVQLIWSGGDKEKVGQARQRITWAVIGLALLSLAFVIFRILEGILGFKLIG